MVISNPTFFTTLSRFYIVFYNVVILTIQEAQRTMKGKIVSKKLDLKKKTVADLNGKKMDTLRGGLKVSADDCECIEDSCITCETCTCDTMCLASCFTLCIK